MSNGCFSRSTESESRSSLDLFVATMRDLVMSAKKGETDRFAGAPFHAPRARLDETRAARKPILKWERPDPREVEPQAAAEDCCVSGAAGCGDLVVETCVCDADPYCCSNAWDSLCVGEVDSLGCGTCGTEVACCSASGDAGCENAGTEACVCDADPYCCNVAWDSLCVNEVESLGCGSCGPVDLVISDLTVPDEACLGEDIAIRTALTVTNDGSDPLTPTIGIAWYLSSDTTWDTGDRLLLGGRD